MFFRSRSSSPVTSLFHGIKKNIAKLFCRRMKSNKQSESPVVVKDEEKPDTSSTHHSDSTICPSSDGDTSSQSSNNTILKEPETQVPLMPATKVKRVIQVGGWALGKMIGKGAFGNVHMAKHIATRKEGVVKIQKRPKIKDGVVASKGLQEMLYRQEMILITEAAIGLSFNHPNIPKMLDVQVSEKDFYCFFEFAKGESLEEYVLRKKRLSELDARGIFRQIVSAIDYAHRNNVIHRDIKLDNIRYDEESKTVKVLDFGVGGFFGDGFILEARYGTPAYASPEILEGTKYFGPELDIWSLGVCLYVMLVGDFPFDGESMEEFIENVCEGPIKYPDFLSRDVINLIDSMLSPDLRERADMDAVVNHPWLNYSYPGPPIRAKKLEQKDIPNSVAANVMGAASTCDASNVLLTIVQEKREIRCQELEGTMHKIKDRRKNWFKKIWSRKAFS